MKRSYRFQEELTSIEFEKLKGSEVLLGKTRYRYDLKKLGPGSKLVILSEITDEQSVQQFQFVVVKDKEKRFVYQGSQCICLEPDSLEKRVYEQGALGGESQGEIKAPMPGTLIQILQTKGSKVKEGETLAVVEAMKMEHALKAPFNGVVKNVHCSEKSRVDKDQVILSLEAEDANDGS